MYIPEEKIDEVRAATDIVEVVGDFVRLKRRGGNFVGLCPFHDEKTPSFNVNPERGIFKCFGCGAGGNVFHFLMRIEGGEFPEVVRTLAERAGVELPERQAEGSGNSERESVLNALRFAARFYYKALTQQKEGKKALEYLEERGITPESIKSFGLGYSLDSWDALLKAAEKEHISEEVLQKAGLIIPRKDGSGFYDRYRDRIIFPIFSHVGKVLGFGGRIMKPADDQPKYINSPETLVYHKSKVLYGLHQARQAIRRAEEVWLVEGYTDVIGLHQAGLEHAVATSGTALTPAQVALLKRYANRVVMLYDADDAGANAALRGIDLLLEQGLSVYALALPEGDDPDSFVRRDGAPAFEEFMAKHRKDFVEFKYDTAVRMNQWESPEDQAATIRSVVGSIAKMPDPALRESYIHRAAKVLRIPDIRLHEILERMKPGQKPSRRSEPAMPPPVFREEDDEVYHDVDEVEMQAAPLPEEKLLLRLMLSEGAPLVAFILGNMALDEFTQGPVQRIVHQLITMYNAGSIDTHRLLDESNDPAIQRLIAELMVDSHQPSANWERKHTIIVPKLNQDPFEAAADAMTLLKLDRVRAAIKKQSDKIFQADQNNQDIVPLQEEMIALYTLRKQIEQRAFLKWNAD